MRLPQSMRGQLLLAALGGASVVLLIQQLKMRRKTKEKRVLLTLRDFIEEGHDKLPPAHAAWISDGAADCKTLQANASDWSAAGLELMPRAAVDMSEPVDLSTTVRLGRASLPLEWPVLVAPVSYQQLCHPEGELASARGAASSATPFVASHAMSYTSEEVAAAAASADDQAILWQQLYFLSTREATLSFVRRVEATGRFSALVVTVDHAVAGLREGGLRAGFLFPPHVRWANLDASPRDWAQSAAQLSSGVTWEDIRWLCEASRLPVLVKGVMCAEDARRAASSGAVAVIVSNHGGRQLDQGPSTAAVLESVCEALREGACDVDVLVDGGIRRGSDVVKALALGAKAVLVGRPVVFGLACDGEAGVRAVLGVLRKEIEATMALCGCKRATDISGLTLARHHLAHPPAPRACFEALREEASAG
jgi:4-hydroxymandelate oxidase